MIYADLREARLGEGMTLGELAKLTGIAQPNLSRFERGNVDARLSTITAVASALRISIELVPLRVLTLGEVKERMALGSVRLAEEGMDDRKAERRLNWKRDRGLDTDVEERVLR
jgi:transcriptional regulator with XRE-family HTH domain